MSCDRCKGTGVDPVERAQEHYGDNQIRDLEVPCTVCVLTTPEPLYEYECPRCHGSVTGGETWSGSPLDGPDNVIYCLDRKCGWFEYV